jgi:hypothetical protein
VPACWVQHIQVQHIRGHVQHGAWGLGHAFPATFGDTVYPENRALQRLAVHSPTWKRCALATSSAMCMCPFSRAWVQSTACRRASQPHEEAVMPPLVSEVSASSSAVYHWCKVGTHSAM